jgi:hypothetical protein
MEAIVPTGEPAVALRAPSSSPASGRNQLKSNGNLAILIVAEKIFDASQLKSRYSNYLTCVSHFD